MPPLPAFDLMVQAEHLRKTYGPAPVLDDVSLELAAGQGLTLLGANGTGKTTLLRILATLLRPTAGSLRIAGTDAVKEPDVVRSAIDMVGHGSWIYEDLTAIENLRFWTVMGGHDAAHARLHAALESVELDTVADRRARTFSAGMKRRLALARVLLGRARLLLLDEPFTGLDRAGRKWLAEFLMSFKSRGGALVVATHSFDAGVGVADRVAILASGRIVLDRPAAELGLEDLRRLYDELAMGPATAS
ncbi:MAG TPA: heme ABC exporter ATP-binding protein CcmA [Methylomirabilota bacterium]